MSSLPKNLINRSRDYVEYIKIFSRGVDANLDARQATLEQDIDRAKKLHASVYLSRGFIPIGAYDKKTGHISAEFDPYQAHSTIFVVAAPDGEIIVTARQIYNPTAKKFSQPFFEQAKIDRKYRKYVETFQPQQVVEISGLAKVRGRSSAATLYLYREMFQFSIKHNHKLWLMACDLRLYDRLKVLFGPAIQKAGKQTSYYGGDIIPAIVTLDNSLPSLLNIGDQMNPLNRQLRRKVAKLFVQNLDVSLLNPAVTELLRKRRII